MVGLALAAAGCGSDESESEAETTSGGATTDGATTTAAATTSGDLPQGSEPVDMDPADFTTQIDNAYWPMDPGTRWTYRETDEEGAKLEVVVTVTGATKEIANGVTARVVRDSVTEDGKLIEDTFDWYAQDAEGNVWYMGENTAEFENGKVKTRGGSFEAGVDGAQAGIIMPADPQDGMQYRQEYYEGEAEDMFEIKTVGGSQDVPAGSFDDVITTTDWNPLDPKVIEEKQYAPGVGLIYETKVAGGEGLVELIEFSPPS
ncbi:MAG: hypothetical protein H0V69_01415 [Acidimicrobiia bacterium]|nr:hypothetical protein [Acidimicrobiia bacterium]